MPCCVWFLVETQRLIRWQTRALCSCRLHGLRCCLSCTPASSARRPLPPPPPVPYAGAPPRGWGTAWPRRPGVGCLLGRRPCRNSAADPLGNLSVGWGKVNRINIKHGLGHFLQPPPKPTDSHTDSPNPYECHTDSLFHPDLVLNLY